MTMRQESRRQGSSESHWPEGAGVVLGFFFGATATCAALLEHTFPSIGRKDDRTVTETTTGGKMSEATSEVSSKGEMGEWKSA
ncbi:hypothetical protein D6D22_04107 [Aureobasidium pullulans]|uniref:Uncharacterized protein n=1 Tax=Aureobasidium pullulans TaxID=5580 RepID=A0A4S8Y0R2_AURPU|nr:hypothetical protein D6D22_04107 [Aureobasidium pullulans]